MYAELVGFGATTVLLSLEFFGETFGKPGRNYSAAQNSETIKLFSKCNFSSQ